MAKSKNTEPAKSKAQAIREAIEQLQSEKRESTTALKDCELLPWAGASRTRRRWMFTTQRRGRSCGRRRRLGKPFQRKRRRPRQLQNPPVPSTNGITKTEAVKEALEKLGADAKPKAVVEHVKQEHGLDISSQLVSNYKATKGKKVGKRGRPRKVSVEGAARRSPSRFPSLATSPWMTSGWSRNWPTGSARRRFVSSPKSWPEPLQGIGSEQKLLARFPASFHDLGGVLVVRRLLRGRRRLLGRADGS